MLRDDTQLISVDDHIIEPSDVWADRISSRYADTLPQVIELDTGRQAWQYDGKVFPTVGTSASAGKDPSQFTTDPTRFDDMRQGCFDPVERLKDMDTDGVWASLCFPTFPRFCGQTFLEADDKDLALLCVRAYNDFILDEWCAADPRRFIPMGIVPLWDVELAVAELRRAAARGLKALAFSENPSPLGLPSFGSGHWAPLFAAAEELEVPLCMHIGSSSKMIDSSPDAPYPVHVILNGLNAVVATSDLLCSGQLQKFPQLKIALSEGGAGWVPYILEKANWTWERHGLYGGLDMSVSPEELFHRHFGVCFIQDNLAIELREKIGMDMLMWECDYPHPDSAWPNSRSTLAKALLDVPDDEAHAIAEGNARTFFRFPRT